MAGGTGGHIFPALSIAERLQRDGVEVHWLGSDAGLERQLVGKTAIPLHLISARGLRGKGPLRLLLAPLMMLRSTFQALRVLVRVDPDCVLGMGGFVTGPGGIAARLSRRPLLIHEQNAVPGITNRLLAPLAARVLEAFPGTFKPSARTVMVGNPVRRIIVQAANGTRPGRQGLLRVLVLGGSQGAQAINEVIPATLIRWPIETRPQVLHQAGSSKQSGTEARYLQLSIETGADVRVVEFIDDMAAAYQWADLVVCRSGASTVAEIAVAGLPAVLIPYPHHKDQQQLKNARWLADAGAAIILEQQDLTPARLGDLLVELNEDREKLAAMSAAAARVAVFDADTRIAGYCLEAAGG